MTEGNLGFELIMRDEDLCISYYAEYQEASFAIAISNAIPATIYRRGKHGKIPFRPRLPLAVVHKSTKYWQVTVDKSHFTHSVLKDPEK